MTLPMRIVEATKGGRTTTTDVEKAARQSEPSRCIPGSSTEGEICAQDWTPRGIFIVDDDPEITESLSAIFLKML